MPGVRPYTARETCYIRQHWRPKLGVMAVVDQNPNETDPSGDKSPVGRFELRLGPLKEQWFAFCQERQVNPTEAIKHAMRRLIQAGNAPTKIYEVQPVIERKSRIEIQLTESERKGAEQRAKDEGFKNANLWIAATVRVALTKSPQFGQKELDALQASNSQLLAIGRNLNQIAKRMNAAKDDLVVTEDDVKMVDDLAQAVRRHVKKVGDALRASIYRWGIK